MPIEIKPQEPNGVCIVGSGDLTGDDLWESNQQIYSSSGLIKKYHYQIMDFRKVSSLNVSYDMIEKLTEQDKGAYRINPGIKMVCVTENDNIFNILKMWESFVTIESFKTKVVRTMDEAHEWLGLEKAP